MADVPDTWNWMGTGEVVLAREGLGEGFSNK